MKRRTVLKAGLAAGALGLTGGAAGLAALQPRKTFWPPFGKGTRPVLPSRKRVVVVGGGLAGMASAAVLASKGAEVTLIEKGHHLGGKLGGWPLEVLGETVPMEHGFHGFFSQYYNLRALLAEARADRDFVPQPSYTVMFADGREEPFGAGLLPFPVDLVEVLAKSSSLSLSDVAGDRPGMRALLSYDPVKTFARWDGVDAHTFVREGMLGGPFAELILRPFGQASMNPLRGFSAAELIRFFHFYMLGNPEGLGFDALGRGVHLSVLDPLRAHLERLGVTIRTGEAVHSVLFESGKAVGVSVGQGAQDTVNFTEEMVPDEGWVALGGVFVRRKGDGFEGLDGRCTHMGCAVALSERGFLCPCHAGRYDNEGKVLSGPPPRALAPVPVVRSERSLQALVGTTEREVIPADAVVLATEVGGLKALSVKSRFVEHVPTLHRAVHSQGMADPYAVVRFWLDAPVDPKRTSFYTVAGYPWTDSLATYSSFQASAMGWAERTGGSVVESHAYAIPSDQQDSPEVYAEALLRELRSAFPELATAKVLHREAMAQSNFTRFAPGDFANRPPVTTEVPNLVLAGDHIQLPFPAFLMEAAVASGRLAANHLLAAEGVEEVPIPTVALRGTLAGLV